MGVKNAIFNGKLVEEIYMEQSDDFKVDKDDNKVSKLKSSIYDFKKSSR